MESYSFTIDELKVLHKVFIKINPKEYYSDYHSVMSCELSWADSNIEDFINWIDRRKDSDSFKGFIEILKTMS